MPLQPFVIKIPVSNSYRIIEIDDERKVSDLLQLATLTFGLGYSQHVYFHFPHLPDPLPNDSPLVNLQIKRNVINFLKFKSN